MSKIHLPPWHPKQLQVFNSKATEILFAGDTRAGKSFYIRKAYIRFCAEIPGLQCDIFRLNFDDVIAENMEGETSFPILLEEWEKDGLVKINQTEVIFWNESRISLEHCSDDNVMLKHRGIAKHVRTFAESTQILEHRIRALTGWVTMSDEMRTRVPEKWKGLFPKVYHITNPRGVSVNFYRRNFVDCRPPYSIEKVGAFLRQYVPAFIDDNPSEDKQATIDRISEAFPDKSAQDSFITKDKEGISNWHTGGGEFFPEWNRERHVCKDFWPPPHWYRYRSMDIGWSEPAAIYYIAVSDGQAFRDHNGKERWFPRGARIFYNEWYICDPKHPAKGLGLSNEDMAYGILERAEESAKRVHTLTDSKPFQGTGQETPALVFQRCGVSLTQVNTGPGSRISGWSIMRSALRGINIDGFKEKLPMVYFCECCSNAISYIPALPYHQSELKKEDAAESGEATHAPDAVRYGLVGHPVIKEAPLDSQVLMNKELKPKKPNVKALLEPGERFF